ncbi:MAG: hypothetical protein MI976_04735 [Pseudomonadales bacterium]|nr:hypothetical protein [Pseudomonadales bacterium]
MKIIRLNKPVWLALLVLLSACGSSPSQNDSKTAATTPAHPWPEAKILRYQDKKWPKLHQGMSLNAFFQQMPFVKKIRVISGVELLEYSGKQRFVFYDNKLDLTQPIQQCGFFPNGTSA